MSLGAEFYLVNATAALLWLLQNIPHPLLLSIFTIGALSIVIVTLACCWKVATTTGRILCRIVTIVIFRAGVRFVNTFLRAALSWRQGRVPDLHRPRIHLLELSDHSSSHTQDLRRSLPQTLALHPQEWRAIEGNSRRSTRPTPSSAENPSDHSIVASPPTSSSSTSRRSRRQQYRTRTLDSA